ncbi:MAG: hypothetical protein AAFS07_18460 [Pseudomonadota bacterium]
MGNGIGQAASTAKTATFTEMKTELEKTGDNDRSIRAGKSQVWTNSKTWNVATNIFFGIGKMIRACFNEKTQGATAIKDAINAEFGVKIAAATGQSEYANEFADSVIEKLYKQNKISSKTELKVGDLAVIKQAIDRYSDQIDYGGRMLAAENAASRMVQGQSFSAARSHDAPTVGEDIDTLTKAIEDKSLPKDLKDQAVSALKSHFEPILAIKDRNERLEAFEKSMQKKKSSANQSDEVKLTPLHKDTYKALFRAKDKEENFIIPKEAQKQLALDAIDKKVAEPKFDSADSFLRNDTFETKLCGAAMQNLDNGALGKIVKSAESVIEVANLQIEDPPCTKAENVRAYRDHYIDETNQALGGAMKGFQPVCAGIYQMASKGELSETRQFLAQISKKTDDANANSNEKYKLSHADKPNDKGMQAINNNELRKGQKDGDTIALQIFILRGVNAGLTENAKNLPESRAEMTTAFTKTLQLAISGNYEFDKGNQGDMPKHAREFDNSTGMFALKNAIA